MCYGKQRRFDAEREERREVRLWELFRRETKRPAPAEPETGREPDPVRELEHEELLTAQRPRD